MERIFTTFWKAWDIACVCCILAKHHFAQQRGLRAKTDKLDATTIARVLLNGEVRRGYVPTEQIAIQLHEHAPRNYERPTDEARVNLAHHSVSTGVATSARSTSLKIRMLTN